MIYQQVPLIRLARGARNLEKDGEWHPFGDDGRTYYRVVNKVMQRVRLEEKEDPELYRLFDPIDPLPSRTAKDGFREEVRISIQDDHYLLHNSWMRAYSEWPVLAAAVASYNGRLELHGDSSLEYSYKMQEFTRDEFLNGLLLGKAISIVGPQLAQDMREGIPHAESDVNGLLHSAYIVLKEDARTKRSRKGKRGQNDHQESLF